LVQGLKWQFSTFTLVLVTHLTELFNVRDWSDNGSAESGTSLYLIRSQRPMWQRGAESRTKVTICSKLYGPQIRKQILKRKLYFGWSFIFWVTKFWFGISCCLLLWIIDFQFFYIGIQFFNNISLVNWKFSTNDKSTTHGLATNFWNCHIVVFKNKAVFCLYYVI